MKKIFTQLLLCMMSALVLYGGAGVNVISYCCDGCRAEGLMAIATDNCCGADDEHAENQMSGDCLEHSEEDCCSFQRIDFEWNTNDITDFKHHLTAQTVIFPVCLNFISLPDVSEIQDDYFLHKPPLINTPEQYLSKLTTLLI
ncbi:MAG: hypothetical protein LBN11_02740 [Tannerella sp.]|nr:hypothetical protein [Tannerella sp.]